MSSTIDVQAIIFQALRNLNEERGADEQIPVSSDTYLFGPESELDSLSLVSVIVDVETAVSEASGKAVSLTDDRALAQEVSPFLNVKSLNAYILQLLSKK